METLSEILKGRRKELGLTLAQIADRMDVSEATVQRWESGNIKSVRYDKLDKLAEILGVPPHVLMGWEALSDFEEPAPEASEKALRVAKLYDLASEREQEIIDLMLKPYEETLKKAAPVVRALATPKKKKPRKDGFEDLDVYDQPAAAGLGNYLDVPVSRREQYPAGYIPKGTSFGVLISGDSMQPRIANGATVFVQAAPALDHGEVGIFVLNGKSYCKQLVIDRERREVRLHSVNQKYDDITVREGDELRTIGRVLDSYPHFDAEDRRDV